MLDLVGLFLGGVDTFLEVPTPNISADAGLVKHSSSWVETESLSDAPTLVRYVSVLQMIHCNDMGR